MSQNPQEVTFDVHSRKPEASLFVDHANLAHEFRLGRFEIAKHGGVVNPSARVGVDETDTGLKSEWSGWRHLPKDALWEHIPGAALYKNGPHEDGFGEQTGSLIAVTLRLWVNESSV